MREYWLLMWPKARTVVEPEFLAPGFANCGDDSGQQEDTPFHLVPGDVLDEAEEQRDGRGGSVAAPEGGLQHRPDGQVEANAGQ